MARVVPLLTPSELTEKLSGAPLLTTSSVAVACVFRCFRSAGALLKLGLF